MQIVFTSWLTRKVSQAKGVFFVSKRNCLQFVADLFVDNKTRRIKCIRSWFETISQLVFGRFAASIRSCFYFCFHFSLVICQSLSLVRNLLAFVFSLFNGPRAPCGYGQVSCKSRCSMCCIGLISNWKTLVQHYPHSAKCDIARGKTEYSERIE